MTKESYFDYDDTLGVPIPWLDQIGDPIEVLGHGRCGQVTKVSWHSHHVALKTFVLKGDDPRALNDVYSHELEVLLSLKSLWGTHVPALLFHKQWQTSPMIALQLGESLADDFDDWSEDDYLKAQETISAVQSLGWYQTDCRGSNFVRLRSKDNSVEYIALIDFESVERRQ